MAKIRHISLTTERPEQVAAFYKEVFDMHEVTRNDRQVLLSDGYINMTIVKCKTEQDADVHEVTRNDRQDYDLFDELSIKRGR